MSVVRRTHGPARLGSDECDRPKPYHGEGSVNWRPIYDEPVTEDDRADLDAAHAEYRRGETLSNEDVRRAMGW